MPIGIGAAMLIGSAVAGGTALGAAKLQSNAASNAQKAQQAATDKAMAVQQQQMAPYQQLGQQALARLSGPALARPYTQQFTGIGSGTGFQPSGSPPSAMQQPQQGPPQGGPMMPPGGQQPSLGMLGQPGPQGPAAQGMSPQTSQPPQTAGLWRMQAPTGEVRDLPMDQAQRALQQGARRIG